MIFQDNSVNALQHAFYSELSNEYDRDEIGNFIFYAFSHFLGYSRTDLVLKKEEKLNESVLVEFIKVIQKLKTHEPIQYILGVAEFYGLQFNITRDVLIPRPETEELVDWVIKDLGTKNTKNKLQVLDIGTGSGCIAISLKKNIPSVSVLALDISENALHIAKRNAAENETEIEFLQADILEHSSWEKIPTLDLIISNPPYVCYSEKEMMDKNVLDYEPHGALFVADNDPLLFYREIAQLAIKKLNKEGKLYFEINETMGKPLTLLLQEMNFKNIVLKKDIPGKDRMLRCEL